jgi:hypothetical protein
VQRYTEMQAFQNSQDRPYIHLVDGGVSDNIGVRRVLEFPRLVLIRLDAYDQLFVDVREGMK